MEIWHCRWKKFTKDVFPTSLTNYYSQLKFINISSYHIPLSPNLFQYASSILKISSVFALSHQLNPSPNPFQV